MIFKRRVAYFAMTHHRTSKITLCNAKHYLLPLGKSVAGGEGSLAMTSSRLLPIGRRMGCIALVISYIML